MFFVSSWFLFTLFWKLIGRYLFSQFSTFRLSNISCVSGFFPVQIINGYCLVLVYEILFSFNNLWQVEPHRVFWYHMLTLTNLSCFSLPLLTNGTTNYAKRNHLCSFFVTAHTVTFQFDFIAVKLIKMERNSVKSFRDSPAHNHLTSTFLFKWNVLDLKLSVS